MKDVKIPGLNTSFSLKGSVDKIEMMMSSGKTKKAGYDIEKGMTGIGKEMIDEKVFKNIDMNTEEIGWSRLNKQKGLSLFGDVDKDRTLNIFDCSPFDMTKQANIHDLLRFGRKKDESIQTPVGELEPYDNEAKRKKEKFITITTIPTESKSVAQKAVEAVKTPWTEKAKGLGFAVGLLKTPEQRLEIEKRRFEFAKAKAAERIAIAKATPPQVPVRVVQDRAGRMVRRVMPPPRIPGFEISPAQKMSGLLGLSPTRVPMYPTFGMGGAGFRQMVTGEEPVQPPVAYPAVGPGVPPSVPVQPVPSRVISPYSKRAVAYTRGPYKKRVIVAQPGYQPETQEYAPQY